MTKNIFLGVIYLIDIEKFFSGFLNMTKNPTLDAMKFFMDVYDHVDEKLKIIHVAGTNGKGACVEIMANILIENGYSVGKFMSPHLIKYNERININNEDISDLDLSDLIIEIMPHIDFYNQNHERKVTLFEIETTLALVYFYRKKVDFVILETGLGGLHDCTNIIKKPLISIITSIGFDHVNILGHSLVEIAQQKAGIIKKNSRTVFFEQNEQVNKIISGTARGRQNKLSFINKNEIKNYSFDFDYQKFSYKDFKNVMLNLKGKSQVKIACLCLESVKILRRMGYKIYKKNIVHALKNIVHRARFEILNQDPLIIFDGAHNKPAIKNLMSTINMYYKNNLARNYLICILKRKDYFGMLKILLEEKYNSRANFIFISVNNGQKDFFVPAQELYEIANEIKNLDQKIYIKTFDEAIGDLFKNNQEQINFVTGSFYVYGEIITTIKDTTQS